jgi:hypothetical protein
MRRLLAVSAVFLLVACDQIPTDVPARAPDRGMELVPDGAFPAPNTPFTPPVGRPTPPQSVAALSTECVVSWELGAFNTSGHSAHGNSFIACATGTVTAIEIDYRGSAIGGRTLTMYAGNTIVGPAYTQTGVALAGGGWNTITLTTGFPVVAGSQYTFLVDVSSPVRFGNSADLTGQWGYFSTWGAPQWQINHRVHIEDPNPTTKDDCMNGGWEAYGFKNQGQCVRFIETGKDSR